MMIVAKSRRTRTYGARRLWDPFSPPHWRWDVAGKIARGEAEPTDQDDAALQTAIRLRTRMERGQQPRPTDELGRAILLAHQIFLEDGHLRAEVEARLLAGQHPRSRPNPRRVAAGRRNRRKRGPLTPEGRERLRHVVLSNQPWLHSTGPKTVDGKRRSAANGRKNQKGEKSVREIRAELDDDLALIAQLRCLMGVLATNKGQC